jgi:RNA polymerase sigma factor (sigma-70 family)
MTMSEDMIVVVDDDAAVREALRTLLRSVGHNVECCSSVEDYLARQIELQPACLILDVRLPGLSGLEFQRRLRNAGDNIPIIFLTGHGDVPISVQAMKDGALEFLTKPFRDQELLDAIQEALERRRSAQQSKRATDALKELHGTLSAREREIMEMVTQGLFNKQIAAQLGLSEVTVKVHRAQVMRKMGAQTLAELVRMRDRIRDDRGYGQELRWQFCRYTKWKAESLICVSSGACRCAMLLTARAQHLLRSKSWNAVSGVLRWNGCSALPGHLAWKSPIYYLKRTVRPMVPNAKS